MWASRVFGLRCWVRGYWSESDNGRIRRFRFGVVVPTLVDASKSIVHATSYGIVRPTLEVEF